MDYDNITIIHVLSSKLWIPGIDDLNLDILGVTTKIFTLYAF